MPRYIGSCSCFLGSQSSCPPPEREALQSTFGLLAGPPPDRFLVALGVLTLLADVASEAPLLCVIDDAQWLDDESAVVFGFVARRLHAERVVMLFAVRELTELASAFQGLRQVVIGNLDDGDAATLLSSIVKSRLSQYVVSRLVAESRGEPACTSGDDCAADPGTARGDRHSAGPAPGCWLAPADVQSPPGEPIAERPAPAGGGRGRTDRPLFAHL